MSDREFEERNKKRTRLILGIGGGFLGVILIIFLVRAVFHDSCTAGFDRAPQSVVQSYINAISSRDVMRGMNCWTKNAYYTLETGCSEICLQRMWGVPFAIDSVNIGPVSENEKGRDEIQAQVTVLCADGTTKESGEISLDTANVKLPWAHWKIIRSTVGGTIANPWCR